MLDAAGNGSVSSPTVDLRPAGDADLQVMAAIVLRHILEKLLHEEGALGSRAHNAHFALQDVEELRKFVQVGPTEKFAHRRAAGVIRSGPMPVTFGRVVKPHGAKFVHAEDPRAQTDALLYKQDGSP